MSRLKTILFVSINALVLLVIAILATVFYLDANTLSSQRAAEVWMGDNDGRFAQVSLFLPDDVKDPKFVESNRTLVENKLKEISYEKPEGASRSFVDAYSANGYVDISSPSNKISGIKAQGVGGDFFFFHSYVLRSGGYFSDDDLTKDRVVIDELLAWKLFGGSDLEGMEVQIGGKPFVIAGVIKRDDDKFSERVYTENTGLFMHYEALNDMTEGGVAVECYEIVMPEPVTNFALGAFEDVVKGLKGESVQNTGRFAVEGLFDLLGNFGTRSIQDSGIALPHWENTARIMEDHLALLLVVMLVLALVPLGSIIFILVKLILLYNKNKTKIKAKTTGYIDRQTDKVRRKRYEKKQEKKVSKRPSERREYEKRKGQISSSHAEAEKAREAVYEPDAIEVDSILKEFSESDDGE